MSSILLSLPELYASYKNWVSSNPKGASDYEITAKWISYFIAGRINNSHIVSELIYALSNLLVLFNDRIITNTRQIQLPTSGDKLKLYLTVLEYSEVFLELSASKLFNNTGRWFIIVAIQVYKCITRLLLLYRHNETIIQTPPIPQLRRQSLFAGETATSSAADSTQNHIESVCFTLKRSGRIMRKADASPPVAMRTWKPVVERPDELENEQAVEKALAGRQLVAEVLYAVKPLVHLSAMGCFGQKAWKPWVISLAMDLASLELYRSCRKTKTDYLSKKQKLQLSKRTVMLIMYLIRSPFYDKFSKDKIDALLKALSNNLPLVGIICNPIMIYLPFWQSNYFYMWSS